jgi:DNA-binding transcriptional regulator YiaG
MQLATIKKRLAKGRKQPSGAARTLTNIARHNPEVLRHQAA